MPHNYYEELRHRHAYFIEKQLKDVQKEAERIGIKFSPQQLDIILRSIEAALAHADANPIRYGNIH